MQCAFRADIAMKYLKVNCYISVVDNFSSSSGSKVSQADTFRFPFRVHLMDVLGFSFNLNILLYIVS